MSTKPNHTDPTYLRTIHDGLLSGAVHKDNSSALPLGLVGMYEEALPHATNVNERKKFLEFFTVWALLKKEVSAEFVTPLLSGWTEEQVIDFIAQYSKWFNSPVSGKYVLYHERLRTFILQKVSAHQFEKCNEQIIHQCQLALQAKTGDERERYALEFLSTHLLIHAMNGQDGETLKALSYNTTHWNRQVEISKGFEWSKRMLNDMMLWASKYDDDEVIECALNKVDLHHLEQNDAPRIVELVAQNDIETALQRIDSFGGNDKEGLQRKFILYMLCLIELTLLDSKDKPFRKEAIEKLLKHLDENLPVDHSVLNWDDFFSVNLVIKIAIELDYSGLDFFILFRHTKVSANWFSWINLGKSPNCLSYRVCKYCVGGMVKNSSNLEMVSILNYLIIQTKNWKAIEETRSLLRQSLNLIFTSQEYGKDRFWLIHHDVGENCDTRLRENVVHCLEIGDYNLALKCFDGILNEEEKSLAIVAICDSLQGLLKPEALILIDRLQQVSKSFISKDHFGKSMFSLVKTLIKIGDINKAVLLAHAINTNYWKSLALIELSSAGPRQSLNKFNFEYYLNGLSVISLISAPYWRAQAFLFALDYSGDNYQMVVEKVLDCAHLIDSDYIRCRVLWSLAGKLQSAGKIKESLQLLGDIEKLSCNIYSIEEKNYIYFWLAFRFLEIGEIEKGFSLLENLDQNTIFTSSFHLFPLLLDNGLFEEICILGKKMQVEEYWVILLRLIQSAFSDGKFYYSGLLLDEIMEISKGLDWKRACALSSNFTLVNREFACALRRKMKIEGIIDFFALITDFYSKKKLDSNVSRNFNKFLCSLHTAFKKGPVHRNDYFFLLEPLVFRKNLYLNDMARFRLIFALLANNNINEAVAEFRSIGLFGKREFSSLLSELMENFSFVDASKFIISVADIRCTQKESGSLFEINLLIDGLMNVFNNSNDIREIEMVVNSLKQPHMEYFNLKCLLGISDILRLKGFFIFGENILKNAFEEILLCKDIEVKNILISACSVIKTQFGFIDDALECIDLSTDEYKKISSLVRISSILYARAEFNNAIGALSKALELSNILSDKDDIDYIRKLDAYERIVSEMIAQDRLNEAHKLVSAIAILQTNENALFSLFKAYLKQGQVELAITIAEKLSLNNNVESAYLELFHEYMKIGQNERADFFLMNVLLKANNLSNIEDRGKVMYEVICALMDHGRCDDAIRLSKTIICDFARSQALERIIKELVKLGNWSSAEAIALYIPTNSDRITCWRTVARVTYEDFDVISSLRHLHLLTSYPTRLNYLRGWVDVLDEEEVNISIVREVLSFLTFDSHYIEILLQKYAYHEVFFGSASTEKINRLNRTLNIQWAIDIAAQFPKEETTARLSTNLETWLHEIADEDDRDQITLWAKQVAKGKITEEEFGERVMKGIR